PLSLHAALPIFDRRENVFRRRQHDHGFRIFPSVVAPSHAPVLRHDQGDAALLVRQESVGEGDDVRGVDLGEEVAFVQTCAATPAEREELFLVPLRAPVGLGDPLAGDCDAVWTGRASDQLHARLRVAGVSYLDGAGVEHDHVYVAASVIGATGEPHAQSASSLKRMLRAGTYWATRATSARCQEAGKGVSGCAARYSASSR